MGRIDIFTAEDIFPLTFLGRVEEEEEEEREGNTYVKRYINWLPSALTLIGPGQSLQSKMILYYIFCQINFLKSINLWK